MFALILKIVAAVVLFSLVALIFIKVVPFLLLILAAIGVWKLYQTFTRPQPPRPPLNWPR